MASVPDTHTFSLRDVVAVTGGNSLRQAFANANDNFLILCIKETRIDKAISEIIRKLSKYSSLQSAFQVTIQVL